MHLAHVCMHCGTDTAPVRAAREPYYGLMLVRCPGCRRASVRASHPGGRLVRRFRRLDLTVTVLGLNLTACVGLGIAAAAAALWIADHRAATPSELWKDRTLELAWTTLLLPLLIGAWLTLGLPHWRRLIAWIAFPVAVVAGTATVLVVYLIAMMVIGQADFPRPMLSRLAVELTAFIAALLLIMLVAALGIGPGLFIRMLLGHAVRAVRRQRRRRRRMERRS